MMRSLFTGVSGIKVHQTKMDVIGNNISNVNTIGFKSSSVSFSDVLYQTSQGASGPNAKTGTAGRNAMQVGLGAGVASITAAMTKAGPSQRTDAPLDVMIEGDSFFVVNNGGANYFTKAGSFNIDAQGTLCTPSGASVMGWQVDPNDKTKTVADAVSPLKIMSPENLYAEPEATTNVYISGNIDNKDTQLTSSTGRIVNINFFDKMGRSYTADMLVKQSEEANNIYTLDIKDIKGKDGQSIFVKKEVDPISGQIKYLETAYKGVALKVPDETGGTTDQVDENVQFDEATGDVKIDLGTLPTLKFNGSTGAFTTVGEGDDPKKSLSFSIGGEPNPFSTIDVDFSTLTMYATSGSSSLESNTGSLTGAGKGKQVGNMSGVNIDTSGKIFGKYDNGDNKLLGQIAVASFSNPAGLEAVGNNMFAATQNSGDFDGIGQDPTQGGGSLSTGVLEMSNVDLSQQFTDMITTQRGFQANSRIITTSDTLLEELINLKR